MGSADGVWGEASATVDRSLDEASGRTYTIGELAEELGLTLRALRFYEGEGLVTPAREGQQRVYSHRDRARLMVICRGKRLGFSVEEIKEFLALYAVDDRQVGQMRWALDKVRYRCRQLEQQLRDVHQTLAELADVEREIQEHLARHGATEGTAQAPAEGVHGKG